MATPKATLEDGQHGPTLWQPFWIRRGVLLAFATLFTVMWLALILVWQIALKHDGLALSLSTSHYAWTYGPTAVFVVVTGLWTQVDYFCKTTQAWQDMSKGPTPAHRSVLLDYMTPLLPNTMVLACRNRHFAVFASTLAIVVLKLNTIVSTTLLVALPTPVTQSISVQWSNTFSATSLWPSVVSSYINYFGQQPDIAPFVIQFDYLPAYTNISSSPVFSFLGGLEGQSSDEIGIIDSLAFTTFEDRDAKTPLTTVAATASVFEPRVMCEEAKVTPRATVFGANPIILELTSETCSVGQMNTINSHGALVNQSFIFFQSLCLDTDKTNCAYEPNVSLFYRLQRVNCDDQGSVTTDLSLSDPAPETLDSATSTDYRLLLLTATRSNKPLGSRDITGNLSAQVDSAALICRIRYDVVPGVATKDMTTQNWSVEAATNDAGGKHLNITDLQLSELVFSALFDSSDIFGPDPAVQQSQYVASYPMFKLMGKAIGDESSFKPFLQAATMRAAAERVFGGIAGRLAQQKLLVPDTTVGTGDATFNDNRLHVRIVALWVMVAAFILMTGLAALLMVVILTDVLPGNLSHIATLGTILASSDSMQRLIRACGESRLSHIRRWIQHRKFQTLFGPPFELQASDSDDEAVILATKTKDKKTKKKRHEKSKKQNKQKVKRTWVPFPFRKPAIVVVLLLPCIVIGVLELLYRLSNHRRGLFPMASDKSLYSYLVRYISTSVMLLVSTIFNSVDFNVATFAPFSALRSGPISAFRTLHQTLLGVLPPVAFYKALRMRQYGAAASNAASTIGSVLTIVVSGLWLLDDSILIDTPATALLSSPWNTAWNGSDDGGAATLLNSIQHRSATAPNAIFGDLVLPHVVDITEIDNKKLVVANDTYSYEFTVPALHPVLSCDVVPSENMLFTYYTEITHSGLIEGTIVTVTAELPDGCDLGTNSGFNSLGFNTTWSGSADGPGADTNAWGGMLVDLRLGSAMPLKSEHGPDLQTATDDARPYPPGGCPSIGAIYGYFRGNGTDPKDVTAIMCQQKVQEIMVDVSYTQDLSIDHSKPLPPWSPDAATNLTDGSQGPDSFTYHVVPHMLGSFTQFNWVRDSSMGDGAAPDASDPFFNHLVWGPNGTSHEDLLGPANAQRLIDGVSNLYTKYMLEVIDRNFRGSFVGSGSNEKRQKNPSSVGVLQGTVFRPGMPRLRVASGSKIALQAMLGTMVLLVAFAYWQVDVRGTLPRNPWPIASTMALLVDSELLKKEIPKAGNGSKKVGRGNESHDLDCSLGWWDTSQEMVTLATVDGRPTLPGNTVPKRISGHTTAADAPPTTTPQANGLLTTEVPSSEGFAEDVLSGGTPTESGEMSARENLAEETAANQPSRETTPNSEPPVTTERMDEPNSTGSAPAAEGLDEDPRPEEPRPEDTSSQETPTTETTIETATTKIEISPRRFGIDIGQPLAFGYSGKTEQKIRLPWRSK